MADKSQDILELLALKLYGKIIIARLESLSWLKIATEDRVSVCTSTIAYYHKTKLLDYITIYIYT